jgi:xylulokinase
MTFLGIDIGTSAVKAVLVDEDDSVRAEADFPLATHYFDAGAAEQNPDDWWTATLAAIDDIRRVDPDGFAALRGIGLTGQPYATVILDHADQVIRPAMTWNDARAISECTLLDRQIPELAAIAGAAPLPAFAAPKLLWLRENEADHFDRIARVLSAKDFVRLRLTGEAATDLSDAAGTLLVAEETRQWSGAIVAASGISRAVLPTLLEGPAWSGMVLRDLLADWGIAGPVVVAAGAGEAAASAIGIGAIRDGDAVIALGAAGQVFVARDAYRPHLHAPLQTFAHALPGRWYDTATLFNATLALEWLTGMLGEPDIGRLVARAQESFAGPSPLLFVPYLAGERAPFNDPEARGAFAGIDEDSGQRDMTQAVLEGIALTLQEAEETFGDAFPAGAVPLVGEGSRSALFLVIVASVLNRPLLRVSNADIAAAFGAARLGRMAATGESAESVCVQPPLLEVVDPVADLHAAYAARRADFRAFADTVREVKPARAATGDRRRRARR